MPETGFILARSHRVVLTIGASAIIGAIVSLAVGAFNLGDAYRSNRGSIEQWGEHVTSLEKNYNALLTQVNMLSSVVQDEKRFSDQIVNVQSQIVTLTQSLQGTGRSLADLALEMSKARELAARTDERVLLLDEIIKKWDMGRDGRRVP